MKPDNKKAILLTAGIGFCDHHLSNCEKGIKILVADHEKESIPDLIFNGIKNSEVVFINDDIEIHREKELINGIEQYKKPIPFELTNVDGSYNDYLPPKPKAKHHNSSGHNIGKTRKKNKAARKQRKRK